MHELSVAVDLLHAVLAVAREHHAERVTRVGVRLGALSSIDPAALRFAWPDCTAGTSAEQAELVIEQVAAVARCAEHGPVRLVLTRGLRCPHCDLPTPKLVQGDELELDTLEFV